jgi:hypothetical protein
MIEIGQRNDRRTSLHHLADLGLPHQHDAGKGRAQDGVAERDFCKVQSLPGAFNIGLRHSNILLGGGRGSVIAGQRGVRLLEGSERQVARLDGNCAGLEQAAVTI